LPAATPATTKLQGKRPWRKKSGRRSDPVSREETLVVLFFHYAPPLIMPLSNWTDFSSETRSAALFQQSSGKTVAKMIHPPSLRIQQHKHQAIEINKETL